MKKYCIFIRKYIFLIKNITRKYIVKVLTKNYNKFNIKILKMYNISSSIEIFSENDI